MVALTIILALLPGFAWLFFYLHEDPHVEPKRFILYTFFMGAAAALVALFIEFAFQGGLVGLGINEFAPVSLFILAAIEELTKFWFTKISVRNNPAFKAPIDAMIYMIVAALGFATIENLGAIQGTTSASGSALLTDIFQIASFRFVGATLLHTLTSGLVGYYWAKSIRYFGSKRPLVFGLVLATTLHAIFNYLIVAYGTAIFPLIFLIIVGFFVLGDFERLKYAVI